MTEQLTTNQQLPYYQGSDPADGATQQQALAQRLDTVLAVDAAAAMGSLRTLGPGAQQAAPGNDARLTKTFRTGHTWVLAGTISAITVPPFFVPEASGQATTIVSVRHRLTSGGNIVAQLTLNGSGIGSTFSVTQTPTS